MTRDRIRSEQEQDPDRPVRIIRVTVATTSPLTVRLPGGAIVPGIKVAGCTYTVDGLADALYQEPSVWSVLPRA